MTTLQIGSALGIAIVGGVFYSVLGTRSDLAAYAHAFRTAVTCNVVLLIAAAVLSLFLPKGKRQENPISPIASATMHPARNAR
jgi:xanthine/uracil permease